MKSPFGKNHDDAEDLALRSSALSGDKKALEKLINKHYQFIYNVAFKMVMEKADAEDITQEIIIKLITNLAKFRGDAAFRTWLYKIVTNHILNMNKKHCEALIGTFEEYGKALDRMPDSDYSGTQINPEKQVILKEVKYSCTAGMLMCLSREQRLIYVLGEIFELDHLIAAEILSISKENFRQKLSRARHQLLQFMSEKCGLINQQNPCRCNKKARAFIDQGIVNPSNFLFYSDFKEKIRQQVPETETSMENQLDKQYAYLFQDTPYNDNVVLKDKLLRVLDNSSFKRSFDL
ncbi:MAG: RNA polymerase sigma factor [Cytophagales bacterium]|nr:RNA polymerase sigma factor [Cytophagales bacterium]